MNTCKYVCVSSGLIPGRPILGSEPATASYCACREQKACSASAEGSLRSAALGSAFQGC